MKKKKTIPQKNKPIGEWEKTYYKYLMALLPLIISTSSGYGFFAWYLQHNNFFGAVGVGLIISATTCMVLTMGFLYPEEVVKMWKKINS